MAKEPRATALAMTGPARQEEPELAGSPTAIQRLHQSIGNDAVQRALHRPGGDDTLAGRIRARLGAGGRLATDVQQRLEHGLGGGLDHVRVHTDGAADHLARSLAARAFTTGSDIFFRAGSYDPGTPAGLHVLAHEASHTLQQARGSVDGKQVGGGVRVSDPGDRFERAADLAARRVVAGEVAPLAVPAAVRSRAPVVQRLADLHGHGCGCQGCGGLVVQRFPAMNDLSPELWTSESYVYGSKRSTEFVVIDAAVAQWDEVRGVPGKFAERVRALEAIVAAIDDWRDARGLRATSKWWTTSTRETAADTLETSTRALLHDERARLRDQELRVARGRERRAFGVAMDPRFADYAKRTVEDDRWEDVDEGSILDWLSRPRGPAGELSDEAVGGINAVAADDIAKIIAQSEDSGIEDSELDAAGLAKLAEKYRNEVTGTSSFPELENVYAPNDEADEVVTESLDLAGVSWPVTYNPSDVHLETKLAAVRSAIEKITARGFRPPVLRLHLPKFGRTLSVGGECTVKDKTERAVFHAPDFLHISSNALGLPLLDPVRWKAADTGLNDGYKYSSTVLDPSGVATMIHEMGHAFHYANSPERFHGLFFTALKDDTQRAAVCGQVSEYGAGNPREFVAEVFLGLVYGRSYSDEIMTMYVAFGGALPPELAREFSERRDSIPL